VGMLAVMLVGFHSETDIGLSLKNNVN